MKKIVFWSPFIGKVGTVGAVINSAIALQKSRKYKSVVINSLGEFNHLSKAFKRNKIMEVKLYKFPFINYLPKEGKLLSRISFAILFILSFFPLLKFLKKNNNIIFISYLLTSLPIILFKIFPIKHKLYLRVSGKINYNFFRKKFLQFAINKIDKIFFQTTKSKKKFEKILNFNKKKLYFLEDPIIDLDSINILKKQNIEKIYKQKPFFVAIGRLSSQKNFLFLVKCLKEILLTEKRYNFLIIGEGEEKELISNYIIENNISKSIFLLGYKKNIFKYLNKSSGLICTSLWEEPGFIIQEAASCKKIILTSDCESGPAEFLNYGKNGYVFKSNNKKSFIKNFNRMIIERKIHKKKIENNYKKIINYTKPYFYNKINLHFTK